MKIRNTIYLLALAFIIQACGKVPVTNRRQSNLMSEQTLIAMADTAYTEFLQENPPLPDSDARVQRVRRIGNKIRTAAEDYLRRTDAMNRVEGFDWQFNVVDDPTINAWCMPGGRVVFYTGIMELFASDDELAVVMGHEVAHAIARHGNERMSKQIKAGVIGGIIGTTIGSEGTREVFNQAYGLGSALGILAYSRKNESESDKIGLVFMYLAEYNPQAAISFWEKMASGSGEAPPVLLSTHPSDGQRIEDLKAFIPELPKYKNNKN